LNLNPLDARSASQESLRLGHRIHGSLDETARSAFAYRVEGCPYRMRDRCIRIAGATGASNGSAFTVGSELAIDGDLNL
jgi:hypothetical protein